MSVHIYPESGKLDEAIDTLKGFAVGKPVLIEETFPLKCSPRELDQFMTQAKHLKAGWVGFYWGKAIDECPKPARFLTPLRRGGWSCSRRNQVQRTNDGVDDMAPRTSEARLDIFVSDDWVDLYAKPATLERQHP